MDVFEVQLKNNCQAYRGSSWASFNNFITQIGSNLYRPSADGLGNLQYRFDGTDVHDFRYYPEGRLRRFRVFNNSGVVQKTADYYFDGLGRRIAKIIAVPGQDTIYINYSHLGAEDRILFAKYKKGSSVEEALYVDGPGIDDHLFEISDDTGVKTYKKDRLGSVLNSAAIGGKSVYGVCGENLGTSVSASTFAEPVIYAFQGREYDQELGLYNFRARSYDPTTCRFLTKDPIGIAGGINPYVAFGNNPVNFTDPYGTDPISASVVLIGAGIGGIAGGTAAYLGGARDFSTIGTAAAIGAAAGATSVISGAVATGYAAAAAANALIGGAANIATQVAMGASEINYNSVALSAATGGISGIFGVAAGNAAFFSTPVIGNPVGMSTAVRAGQVAGTVYGGIAGGVLDNGLTCRR